MTQVNGARTVAGLRVSRVIPVVWAITLLTGLAVVYSSHQCRLLYSDVAVLEQEKNRLEVEWGQYLLEESSLASLQRIETLARENLGMQVSTLEHTVMVRP